MGKVATHNRVGNNGHGRVMSGPSVEVETWTPERAKAALENNTRNRPMRWSWVLALAAAMEAGEWKLNGETIKFANDTVIEDGQHRLAAIVHSGVTVKILTVRNLAKDVFDTIDIGAKRSGSDILARRREPNAPTVSAGLTWLWRYEHGLTSKQLRPRDSVLPDLLESHPEMRESARLVQLGKKRLPPGIAAACHYLFAKKNSQQAEDFFEKLSKGEQLAATDPVYVLRETLGDHLSGKKKISKPTMFALTIKAWNYVRAGEKIRRLTFRETASASLPAEPFPKVK